MFSKYFLENLFNLYNEHEIILHKQNNNVKLSSCYGKYLNSLPKNYIFNFPNTVILKLTEACNLRCKHCFYAEQPEYYNKKLELNTEELIALIDFLADEINIFSITLTGGEVLIREDFFDILKHIKLKNLIVTIQSNGTLINKKKAKLLGNILNNKTDTIQISIDGADKISHEFIRGTGTFDKTINGIKLLRSQNLKVQINSTLTTISAPKMSNIFNLSKSLDANLLSISRYEVCDNKQQYLKLSNNELMKYSYEILENAKNFEKIKLNYKALCILDFLKYPLGRKILEDYIKTNNLRASQDKCLVCHHHNKITISSEGNIFLCSMDESNDAILGNLRKKNFYEIWENRYNNPYFQKRDITTTKCKNCKYISICNTGCMASAYKKYNDINFPTSDCCYFEEYIRDMNK